MPKSRKKPSYLLHKPTGQARVRIDGKDHYLGEFGSPQSRERYDELISEWLSHQGDLSNYRLSIAELALLFLDHASGYYRKNDKETCEVNNIRIALRPLVRLYGNTPSQEFSPKKLKTVRDRMIERGCVRTSINRQIGRIKRMFRWGGESEYVPVAPYSAICTVAGLKKGRSKAKESDGVKPVSADMINAVKPFVSQQVWAMIQLQILTGMRPGEVVQMRGRDLNMSGKVWEYRPESHKTEHHGNQRVIFLGPKAKAVVRDFLKANLQRIFPSPISRSDCVIKSYADFG
jgi:integrase